MPANAIVRSLEFDFHSGNNFISRSAALSFAIPHGTFREIDRKFISKPLAEHGHKRKTVNATGCRLDSKVEIGMS